MNTEIEKQPFPVECIFRTVDWLTNRYILRNSYPTGLREELDLSRYQNTTPRSARSACAINLVSASFWLTSTSLLLSGLLQNPNIAFFGSMAAAAPLCAGAMLHILKADI